MFGVQDAKYFGQDVFLVVMMIRDPVGTPMTYIRPLTGKEDEAFLKKLALHTHKELVFGLNDGLLDKIKDHARRLANANPHVGPDSKW